MFKVRPYEPDRPDKRSAKQRAANDRNFRIFRLRGLHALCYVLTGARRGMAQALIDDELRLLGAESESKRQDEKRAEWTRLDMIPF